MQPKWAVMVLLVFSISSLSFGDIEVTTSDQPEGTGGTYSPNFFNIGLGYSYMYANKISVGLLVRGVSEALPDITAFGFSIDAGVQYVSGTKIILDWGSHSEILVLQ